MSTDKTTTEDQKVGEFVRIDKLHPHHKNPRNNDHAVDSIANSIKRFGFTSPIIANKDQTILAGHTRYKAAKKIGLQTVPVVYVDLSPVDAELLMIADNKLGEKADWNTDQLSDLLTGLKEQGEDLDVLGFEDHELDELLGDLGDDDPFGDGDAPVEIEIDQINDPISKTGEKYKLGNHVLICGDCTESDNWESIQDSIVFTSPPYSIGDSSYKLSGNTQIDQIYLTEEKQGSEYIDLLIDFTSNALNNSDQVFVNLQFLANSKREIIQYMNHYKDQFCDLLIWDKGHAAPSMAKNVCNSVFECVFVFSKINNSRSMQFGDFRGDQSNIIQAKPQRSNDYADQHGATMSIDFCSKMISVFGEKANCIIDPFGGTGTTLFEAEKLKKRSYLIELEPAYCDIIRKRWALYAVDNGLNVDDGIE